MRGAVRNEQAGRGACLETEPYGRLTPRELEVTRLVIDGLSNHQIAGELEVSPRTVHAHIANAMTRTHTRSRTQLAVFALRSGIVPLNP